MVPKQGLTNGSADDLLKEVSGSGVKEQPKPRISNGTADDLLADLNISKKKSSSPSASGGGNETPPVPEATNNAPQEQQGNTPGEPAPPPPPVKKYDWTGESVFAKPFKDLFGAPGVVKVAGKNVDLSTLPVGPYSADELDKRKPEIKARGQELQKRILERSVTDQDAAIIASKTGDDIQTVKTSINKPETFDLDKSRKAMAADFDVNFKALSQDPILGRAISKLPAGILKQQLLDGNGDAVTAYTETRQKNIADGMAAIDKQMNALVKTTFGLHGAQKKEITDRTRWDELQKQKDMLDNESRNMLLAADKVQTAQLNKKYDGQNGSAAKFDNKEAEGLGLQKLKLVSPVNYKNVQDRLNAGYTLDQQTQYDLAKQGYAMRSEGLAVKFEDAEEKARPVLEAKKKIVDTLDGYSGKLSEAKAAMDKNKTAATVKAYNDEVNKYNQVLSASKKLDEHPAIVEYQQVYNKLKDIVDGEPKLSDHYPEVRRQELTRALHDAYAEMTDDKYMERANPLLHPITKEVGMVQNILGYILNEEPGEHDYKKLAEKFNMTVAEVKRLDVGNLVGDQGFSPEQIKKGADFLKMTPEEFSMLSPSDNRFKNDMINSNIAKAMGVEQSKLNEMKTGMEKLAGYKEHNLRLDGLLSSVAQGVYGTFAGVNKSYNRYFGDGGKQAINIENELIDKTTAQYNRKPDSESGIFGGATKIDTRKTLEDGKPNPYYLREIINENASKFNLTPRSFVSGVGSAVGQMAVYAGMAGGIGRAFGAVSEAGAMGALGGTELAAFKNAASIADITAKATRFGELFGTVASGYAMSYDNYYQAAQAYTTDEATLHKSAATNAFIEGMSELILPDVDIVKAMRGNKNLFSVFNKIITKDGGQLTKDGLRQYLGYALKTVDVAHKEALEEYIVEPATAISDKAILNKDFDWGSVNQAGLRDYVTMFISTLPTGIGAGMGSTSQLKKESLFEAGNEPSTYIAKVQDLVDKKRLSQDKANTVIQNVNTMAEIVRGIPRVDQNGIPYSVEQKIELAAQEFRIRKNSQLKRDSNIGAVNEQADADSKSAHEIQSQILAAADPGEESKPTVDKLKTKVESTLPAYTVDGAPVTKDAFTKIIKDGTHDQHDMVVTNDDKVQEQLRKVGGVDQDTGDTIKKPKNPPPPPATGGAMVEEPVTPATPLVNVDDLTLTERKDLLLKAKHAVGTIKNDIYRDSFKNDLEGSLKEAAQQLNNPDATAAKTAEEAYGPVISEFAKQLFPNEKAPVVDENAMNEANLLPDVSKSGKKKEPAAPAPAPVDVNKTFDEIIADKSLSEPNKIMKAAEAILPLFKNVDIKDKLHLAELSGDKANAIRENKVEAAYIRAKITNTNPELVAAVEKVIDMGDKAPAKDSGLTSVDQKEIERQMEPHVEEMAAIEMKLENEGIIVDGDYDGEISVKDKKTGELMAPEDVPEELRPLVAQYEEATAKLSDYDEQAFISAITKARKKIQGEDADFVEVQKPALPASTKDDTEIHPDAEKKINSLVNALNDGRKGKEKYDLDNVRVLTGTTIGNVLAVDAVNKKTGDKVSTIIKENGDVPEGMSVNWRDAASIANDLKSLVKPKNAPANKPSTTDLIKANPNVHVVKPGAAEPSKEEKKKAAIEAAKKDFLKEFGKLNSGIDPVMLAKGVKLIGTYIDYGTYKFAEIVRDVVDTFGERSHDLLDAMKRVYAAHLAGDDNPELDDIKTVRDFTYDKLDEGNIATDNTDLENLSNLVFANLRSLKANGINMANISAEARELDKQIYNVDTDKLSEVRSKFENLLNVTKTLLDESKTNQGPGEQPAPGSTEAIGSETEAILGEAASSKTDKQKSDAIIKIDEQLAAIDDKLKELKLKGVYRPKEDYDHEQPNILVAREYKKDLAKFSKALGAVLGYEFDTDKKGKPVYANTNIAPAGGDGTIILWKPNSNYGVYLSIPIDPAGLHSDTYQFRKEDAFPGQMMWRVTSKDNKYSGFQNQWNIKPSMTVEEMAKIIAPAVDKLEQSKTSTNVNSNGQRTEIQNQPAGTSGNAGPGTLRNDAAPTDTGEGSGTLQGENGQARPDTGGKSSGGNVSGPGDATGTGEKSDNLGGRGGSVAGDNSDVSTGQQESGGDQSGQGVSDPRIKTFGAGAENYKIDPGTIESLKTFSVTKRFQDNINALTLIRDLSLEGRLATPEEQKTLAKYVGWGGLKDVLLDPSIDSAWKSETAQRNRPYVQQVYDLVNELDPTGRLKYIQAIKRSTANAHYTSIPVIQGIYDAIAHTGFKGGHILDPSAGIGNFYAAMPQGMAKNSELTAVELEPLTAKIYSYLFPQSTIHATGLQDARIPDNNYDLVISNVPFGQFPITDRDYMEHEDKRYRQATKMIHNYFFAKGMDLVRPGGIMAFITSTGTLDAATNRPVRELLADKGEFLGAVRLPNNTFKSNANTEVVTDVIFFRKYNAKEKPKADQPFINSKGSALRNREGQNFTVNYNEYYQAHPEMMIGQPFSGNQTRFNRDDTFDLEAAAGQEDLRKEIGDRLKNELPKNFFREEKIKRNRDIKEKAADYVKAGKFNKVGNLVELPNGNYGTVTGETHIDESLDARARAIHINPDNIRNRTLNYHEEQNLKAAGLSYEDFDIKVVNAVPKNWGKENIKKAGQVIAIRDLVNQVLYAEHNDMGDDYINGIRYELNDRYDKFVKEHGLINAADNARVLEKEVDQFVLRALEVQDKETKRWRKADILSKRTINPKTEINTADNISDAILLSLQEFGTVDMDRISELLKKPAEQILEEEHASEVPQIFSLPGEESNYESRVEYLTGDVKTKLEQAEQAARIDPKYDVNVRELKKVIPADVGRDDPMDVYSPMHARWVAMRHIQDFLKDLLKVNVSLDYDAIDDKLIPRVNGSSAEVQGFAVNTKSIDWLLKNALNNSTPRVEVTNKDGSKTFLEDETALAKNHVETIKKEWDLYKYDKTDRRNDLLTTYNNLYNREVLREYNGRHLTFPGLMGYKLKDHQQDAIWRFLQTKGGILDHMVGAGKTLVMVGIAMEMKRLGIAKKPMITGLKSQIPQLFAEATKAYPLAKILFPSEKDFAPANRKTLLTQIATNDWDIVLIAHSQFDKLVQSPEIALEVIEEMKADIEEALSDAMSRGDKQDIKKYENKLLKLEEKAQKLMDKASDEDVLRFDQLGVDFLTVDESQEYKNLEYNTAKKDVKGLGTQVGSKRAFNMLIAARHLQKMHGGDKGIIFSSGTPISNTMAEMYLLFKFLTPNRLIKNGIKSFDQWASTFAIDNSELEFYLGKLKEVTRFRKFMNLSELLKWYRSIADVRNHLNLTLERPKAVHELVKLDISPFQTELVNKLNSYIATKGNDFAEELRLTKGYDDQKKVNPAYGILAMGYARKMSLDPRLLNFSYQGGDKVNAVAAKIKDYYQRTDHFQGTQLVFSDLGTPKSANTVENLRDHLLTLDTAQEDMNTIFGESYMEGDGTGKAPSVKDVRARIMNLMTLDENEMNALVSEANTDSFNIYQALKDRLVEIGIPSEQVAFIHSYNNRKQKEALYKAVNNGDIRIVIGSTSKMGVGVNMQERAIAAHHMDMPWRPSDLEQRNGRVERQGNVYAKSHWNNQVDIFYYATERTLDTTMYEGVTTKAAFINQIKVSDVNAREAEDVSTDFAISDMAAALSGNPDYKLREKLKKELKNLEVGERAFNSRKYRAQDNLDHAKRNVESFTRHVGDLEKAKTIYEANVTHDIKTPERKEKLQAELEKAEQERRDLPEDTKASDKVKLANKIENLRSSLDDESSPVIFNPIIDGKEYDAVGLAGNAILEVIKKSYNSKVIGKEFKVGSIWGFDIMGTMQRMDGVLGDGRTMMNYRIVSGDVQLDHGLFNSENGVSIGQLIKKPFNNIDSNIDRFRARIEENTTDIPKFEKQLEGDFPDKEKLKTVQSDLNEVEARIRVDIKKEADALRKGNSGNSDDQNGDEGGTKPGDRVRRFKIPRAAYLYSTIVPGAPQLWNAAVELVAKAIDAGYSIADAMRKGYDHIKMNYDKKWARNKYAVNMLDELKSRGYMDYNIDARQQKEADKIINRVSKGANLAAEVAKVKEVFEKAIAGAASAADEKILRDSQAEFEKYLFDKLAIGEITRITSQIDLGLKDQTWIQKQKENYQNRYERGERTQRAMEEQGITIEERNDFMNAADRWKAVAVAKNDEILKEIGLATTDVFIWKGQSKVKNSFFDRMNKTGIPDFYRKLGLYMYAKHAPERNMHNSMQRRQELDYKIGTLEADLIKAQEDYDATPSIEGKAKLTRISNELQTFKAYQDAYSDPDANANYIKVLESKIPSKLRLMDDGGSGMTNSQAEEIIDEVEALGQTDIYEDFSNEFRDKVVSKILEKQAEYELITKEDEDVLQSYYNNYVPLKVDQKYFDDGSSFASSAMSGAKIFRSKGANYITFENRINPLSQSLLDLQATIFKGEENNYKKKLGAAIISAPDAKVWEIKPARFKPVKDKTGRIMRFEEFDVPDNGIPYTEDASKKYLVINDESLRKEITEENVKMAIPLLASINGYFRAINTVYNPNFTVSNLIRDLETAGIVLSSKDKTDLAKYFAGNVKRMFSIIRGSYREQSDKDGGYWTERAKKYKELGGNMTWWHQDTVDNQIKDIEKAYEKYNKSGVFENGKNLGLSIAGFVNKANQAVETSTRVAIFDAALKAGLPEYKAVELARNATINFNKKGNYSAVTDSLFLFANATVQGSANVLKTLLLTKKGRYLAGGIVALGMMQSFLGQAFSDCDIPENCYDNLKDYEKDKYMMIRIPGQKGFFKLPLAYGFNVFYNFGERVAQLMQGKTTAGEAAVKTTASMLNAFNPLGGADTPPEQIVSPTATDPLIQWWTNKDGLGRKIYPDDTRLKSPDSEKTFSSDTPTAVALSKWLNKESGGNDKIKGKVDVSPGTFDWIYQTMTGGLGQFMKQVVNTAGPAVSATVHLDAKELRDYKDIDFKDIPVVNRFYTMPVEKADKTELFNIKDRSYNEILDKDDIAKFNKEVDHAVKLKSLDADKAAKYKNELNKNQFELKNDPFVVEIEQTKKQVLDEDALSALKEKIDAMKENGQISENWAKGYKAEITKNQNKLKAAEKAEE